MGSSYGGRRSAVTGIFVKNWIKADGFLKPQTGVIRFSPLNTDWRMIALNDTWVEKYTQKQAWFEQCGRIVILAHGCLLAGRRPQWSRIYLNVIWVMCTCCIFLQPLVAPPCPLCIALWGNSVHQQHTQTSGFFFLSEYWLFWVYLNLSLFHCLCTTYSKLAQI